MHHNRAIIISNNINPMIDHMYSGAYDNGTSWFEKDNIVEE